MTNRSIEAYDTVERIERYDRDMDIMHFNRHKMAEIAVRMAPFESDAPLRILDLGVGTGFFSRRFLERFPKASIVALDGSAAMIASARVRLSDYADRVRYVTGDSRELEELLDDRQSFDLVITSYALHHLSPEEKAAVIKAATGFLLQNGWLINADLIVSPHAYIEDRFQKLRIEDCIKRADDNDERFNDSVRTRKYLKELEALDGDQPVSLYRDLRALEAGGLRNVDVFWLETREAVTGGIK